MTGRRIANQAQIAMQHRFRCRPSDLMRVDALPPWDAHIAARRYLCASCWLYLTGTHLTAKEQELAE